MERCRNGLAGKFAEWFKIVQFDPLLSSHRKAIRISPQTFAPPSQPLFVFTQFVKSLESRLHTGKKCATGRNATGTYISQLMRKFNARSFKVLPDL